LEGSLRKASIEVYLLRVQHQTDLIALRRLCRFLKDFGPDVVDIYDPNLYWIGILAAKAAKAKVVITRTVDFPIKSRWIVRPFYKRYVDKFIAISKTVKERLVRELSLELGRVVVNPAGIEFFEVEDGKRNALRSELGLNSSFVIGSIGSLDERKGYQYLLEAFAKVNGVLPKTYLVIIGEGSFKEILIHLTERLQIQEKVLFIKPKLEVATFVGLMDLFVLPSLSEGFGSFLLDAMVLRKPVIATDVGGIPEIIENGRTGVLIKPKDSDALAEAIIGLYKNRFNIKDILETARAKVLKEFNKEGMVQRTEMVYKELLNHF
jgi:glycosyltransferase involved in cell wall biosynthesis